MTAPSGPPTAERRSSWRNAVTGNVLMMGLVSFFTDLSSDMMVPLLPVFLTGIMPLGLAALYVGLIEGVAETTASLLKLISGRVSDALGRRKVLAVFGYGLSTLVRPVIGLATHGWHVVLLRFFDRIGKGVRTSPRDALIGDSVSADRRGLAFSFHRAMDHAGAVFGALGSAVILLAFLGYAIWHGEARATPAEMHALRWVFGIALVPGLLAMASLIFRVREIRPQRAHPPHSDYYQTDVWKRLPRRFFYFVGVVTLFALGNSSDLFLLLYAKAKFELGILQILMLWVGLHLSKIAFSIPGGMLSDRFGRRPVIIAGWVVYALVYLGMAVVVREWQFWALFLCYGLYYGMTEGAEKALVADFVPSTLRGTAFGLYHGAVGLAALPASLVFGIVWKSLGPRVAFGIGAALAGLAAALLIVLLATSRVRRQVSGVRGQA